MVEAAGRLIQPFQDGPDYAFIPGLVGQGCGACSPSQRADGSWGRLASSCDEVSRSMSLYRAGLKLALFLPLGVALASRDALGFTDVSSVFILPLRTDATSFLIEPASRSYLRPGLHA